MRLATLIVSLKGCDESVLALSKGQKETGGDGREDTLYTAPPNVRSNLILPQLTPAENL